MAGIGKIAALGLAAAMSSVNFTMPAIGGYRAPRFEDPAPEYDGLGRKKRIVPPVPQSRKRQTRAWQDYAARVVATHSHNEDPRDDKYLHSHARGYRGLRKALAAAGR